MSELLAEAASALRRWRDLNTEEPVPPVAVYLRDRERPIFFNGLAVAPSPAAGVVAVSGLGYSLPIYVLRDADVERVVIGSAQAPFIGFSQIER